MKLMVATNCLNSVCCLQHVPMTAVWVWQVIVLEDHWATCWQLQTRQHVLQQQLLSTMVSTSASRWTLVAVLQWPSLWLPPHCRRKLHGAVTSLKSVSLNSSCISVLFLRSTVTWIFYASQGIGLHCTHGYQKGSGVLFLVLFISTLFLLIFWLLIRHQSKAHMWEKLILNILMFSWWTDIRFFILKSRLFLVVILGHDRPVSLIFSCVCTHM